jgi:hypothetical protein
VLFCACEQRRGQGKNDGAGYRDRLTACLIRDLPGKHHRRRHPREVGRKRNMQLRFAGAQIAGDVR